MGVCRAVFLTRLTVETTMQTSVLGPNTPALAYCWHHMQQLELSPSASLSIHVLCWFYAEFTPPNRQLGLYLFDSVSSRCIASQAPIWHSLPFQPNHSSEPSGGALALALAPELGLPASELSLCDCWTPLPLPLPLPFPLVLPPLLLLLLPPSLASHGGRPGGGLGWPTPDDFFLCPLAFALLLVSGELVRELLERGTTFAVACRGDRLALRELGCPG